MNDSHQNFRKKQTAEENMSLKKEITDQILYSHEPKNKSFKSSSTSYNLIGNSKSLDSRKFTSTLVNHSISKNSSKKVFPDPHNPVKNLSKLYESTQGTKIIIHGDPKKNENFSIISERKYINKRVINAEDSAVKLIKGNRRSNEKNGFFESFKTEEANLNSKIVEDLRNKLEDANRRIMTLVEENNKLKYFEENCNRSKETTPFLLFKLGKANDTISYLSDENDKLVQKVKKSEKEISLLKELYSKKNEIKQNSVNINEKLLEEINKLKGKLEEKRSLSRKERKKKKKKKAKKKKKKKRGESLKGREEVDKDGDSIKRKLEYGEVGIIKKKENLRRFGKDKRVFSYDYSNRRALDRRSFEKGEIFVELEGKRKESNDGSVER